MAARRVVAVAAAGARGRRARPRWSPRWADTGPSHQRGAGRRHRPDDQVPGVPTGESVAESNPSISRADPHRDRRAGPGRPDDDEIRDYSEAGTDGILVTPTSSGVAGLVWIIPVVALVISLAGLADGVPPVGRAGHGRGDRCRSRAGRARPGRSTARRRPSSTVTTGGGGTAARKAAKAAGASGRPPRSAPGRRRHAVRRGPASPGADREPDSPSDADDGGHDRRGGRRRRPPDGRPPPPRPRCAGGPRGASARSCSARSRPRGGARRRRRRRGRLRRPQGRLHGPGRRGHPGHRGPRGRVRRGHGRSHAVPARIAAIAAGVLVVAIVAGVLMAQASGRRNPGDTITGDIRQDQRDLLAQAQSQFGSGQTLDAIRPTTRCCRSSRPTRRR